MLAPSAPAFPQPLQNLLDLGDVFCRRREQGVFQVGGQSGGVARAQRRLRRIGIRMEKFVHFEGPEEGGGGDAGSAHHEQQMEGSSAWKDRDFFTDTPAAARGIHQAEGHIRPYAERGLEHAEAVQSTM